jgi:tetratricopeptide (TPR) repeat protein/V8-like Glu-specific endopeptidase
VILITDQIPKPGRTIPQKMQNPYRLTAAVMGAATTIILIQSYPACAALSTTQVDAIARQVTVKIDGQNPGSGVIVAKEGQTYYVLTAEHVVRTPDEYYVVTLDGQNYKVDYQQVKKLPGVDLALVPFISNQKYQVVAMGSSSQVREGNTVYVTGFPMQGISTTQTRYRFSHGEIAALASQPLANGYALAYFNDTFAGMSGGPLLNQQGQLIGIHGASKARYTDNQGVNPETGTKFGLNLGIPIDTFLRLVTQVTPTLKFPAATPASMTQQTTAGDLFIQAVDQVVAGRFKEAITLAERIIRLQPNYAAAYFLRGTLRPPSDPRSLVADYNQVIRLNPNFALAYTYRGSAHAELGDKQSAIADYNQAIRLNPNDADAYNNRGNARSDLGDKQGAIADFNQSIRLKPEYAYPYNNRGNAYFDLGKKREAIADYNQAIRLNPNYAFAYNNRGQAYAELGNRQSAIADFDQAIRLNPSDAGAYNNRGIARAGLGNQQSALTDFDQAIRLDPKFANSYYNRGIVRAGLGNQQGAIADFQKAAQLAQAQKNRPMYEAAISSLKALQR